MLVNLSCRLGCINLTKKDLKKSQTTFESKLLSRSFGAQRRIFDMFGWVSINSWAGLQATYREELYNMLRQIGVSIFGWYVGNTYLCMFGQLLDLSCFYLAKLELFLIFWCAFSRTDSVCWDFPHQFFSILCMYIATCPKYWNCYKHLVKYIFANCLFLKHFVASKGSNLRIGIHRTELLWLYQYRTCFERLTSNRSIVLLVSMGSAHEVYMFWLSSLMNGGGRRKKKSVPVIGQYYWLILVSLEVQVDIKNSSQKIYPLRGGGTPLSINFLEFFLSITRYFVKKSSVSNLPKYAPKHAWG